MQEWYLVFNGQNIGPMTKEELIAYNPTSDSLVWKEGMANWEALSTIPELMELLEAAQSSKEASSGNVGNSGAYTGNGPYNPGAPNPYMPAKPPKSKTTAGLLAIFLGWLGLQYFYIGKTTGAIINIALSWCTCGIWGIVNLIQGIIMLTMTQEDFEKKYVESTKSWPLF